MNRRAQENTEVPKRTIALILFIAIGVPLFVAAVAGGITSYATGSDEAAGAVVVGVFFGLPVLMTIALSPGTAAIRQISPFIAGGVLGAAALVINAAGGPRWLMWLLFAPAAALMLLGYIQRRQRNS